MLEQKFSTFTVRPALPEDLTGIVSVHHESAKIYENLHSKEVWNATFSKEILKQLWQKTFDEQQQNPLLMSFVAEENQTKKIIGVARCMVITDEKAKDFFTKIIENSDRTQQNDFTVPAVFGEFDKLYVHPNSKKMGVGSALLRTMRKFLQLKRVNQAIIVTLNGNKNAEQFYQSFGAVSVGSFQQVSTAIAGCTDSGSSEVSKFNLWCVENLSTMGKNPPHICIGKQEMPLHLKHHLDRQRTEIK